MLDDDIAAAFPVLMTAITTAVRLLLLLVSLVLVLLLITITESIGRDQDPDPAQGPLQKEDTDLGRDLERPLPVLPRLVSCFTSTINTRTSVRGVEPGHAPIADLGRRLQLQVLAL